MGLCFFNPQEWLNLHESLPLILKAFLHLNSMLLPCYVENPLNWELQGVSVVQTEMLQARALKDNRKNACIQNETWDHVGW